MRKINIQKDLKSREAIRNNLYNSAIAREETVVNDKPENKPTHGTGETAQGEADNDEVIPHEKPKKRGRAAKGNA